MILYADTSALVKLVLPEPGTEVVRAAIRDADWVASAAIGYVELRAAVAAAGRDHRVPQTELGRTRLVVDAIWAGVSEVLLDAALLQRAGDLAEQFRLRGYDAVHLAALEAVGDPTAVQLACWDQDLTRAAEELGYSHWR